MPIDPKAVGLKGGPARRSWTSKDALLYALGVGAGVDELAFATENTKDTPQRVLPTMAVVLGGGGIPFDKLGTFNPALMLHGGQGIELFGEIPPDGEIESTGTIAAIWDKGKAASVDLVSDSVNVATGKPLFRTKMTAFFRGEGGFGGERGPAVTFELPARKPDHEVTLRDAHRPGAALPPVGRPQPAPLRSCVREARRLPAPHPARALHLRRHRPRVAAHAVRQRPEPVQGDGGPLLEARHAGRRAHRLDVGGRQAVPVPDEEPGRRGGLRPGRDAFRVGRSRGRRRPVPAPAQESESCASAGTGLRRPEFGREAASRLALWCGVRGGERRPACVGPMS